MQLGFVYLSARDYLGRAPSSIRPKKKVKWKSQTETVSPTRHFYTVHPTQRKIEDDNFSVGSDSVFGSEAQTENGSVLDFSHHGSLPSENFCSSINTTDLSGMSFHSIAEDGRVEQKEIEIKEDLTKAARVSVTDQQYSPKKIVKPDIEDKYKG